MGELCALLVVEGDTSALMQYHQSHQRMHVGGDEVADGCHTVSACRGVHPEGIIGRTIQNTEKYMFSSSSAPRYTCPTGLVVQKSQPGAKVTPPDR